MVIRVSAPPQSAHADLGIINQASVLWRRKFTILLVALFALGAVVVIDLQRTPIYRAQATMEFLSQGSGASQTPPPLTNTELTAAIESMSSPTVKALVTKQLGKPAPPATVSLVSNTQLAKVTVDSASPTLAADAANAYVRAYVHVSQVGFVAKQVAVESDLQDQINQIQTEINSVQIQLASTSPSAASTYAPLSARLSTLYVQQSTVKNQFADVQLSVTQAASGAQMVIPATTPASPFSPARLTDALIGLGIGLLAGCALVFALDRFDDRIRSRDDLVPVVGSVPIIGLIPEVHKWQAKSAPYLVITGQPTSPAAEAYRVLRTALRFLNLERSVSVIQVTSPSTGDGKTTTVANLAVAMAAAGQRVTIVCCDLRRPRIHRFFDMTNEVGVTSVLAGEVPLEEALHDVPGLPLRVLSSGPKPINPAEIIASHHMHELIARLRADCDVVIIDSAPVLPVTDAAALSAQVEGVIVISSTYNSTQRQVKSALEMLRVVDAPVLGVVLNAASQADTYYYYGYYTAPEEEVSKDTEAPRRPPFRRGQPGWYRAVAEALPSGEGEEASRASPQRSRWPWS
jgi:capsular exopolysaccharide synthesis family protein